MNDPHSLSFSSSYDKCSWIDDYDDSPPEPEMTAADYVHEVQRLVTETGLFLGALTSEEKSLVFDDFMSDAPEVVSAARIVSLRRMEFEHIVRVFGQPVTVTHDFDAVWDRSSGPFLEGEGFEAGKDSEDDVSWDPDHASGEGVE
jgi:hypothetical protein